MSTIPVVRDRHAARRLCFYSHKGGVGKTTLSTNISYALADKNKSVLLIDSDPQCNLSAYLLNSQPLDKLLDQSDGEAGQTLWSSLRWTETKEQDPAAIEPTEVPGGLRLVPGDIRMSEFEERLQQYWGECRRREFRGFAGATALSLVVNSICAKYKIDFVIYDCGPNIGPLNRVVLLDCDYFIVPAACDEFSIRAIRSVGYTLERWITQWSDIADLAPDGTYLLPGRPCFLGYVPQQFRVYGGQMTQEFARFISRIDKHVQEDIVGVMNRLDAGLVLLGPKGAEFGEVQNLSSLVSGGQTAGRPVWELGAGSPDLRAAAKESFYLMADRLVDVMAPRSSGK
ncbi:MAG: ParA family protein [Candidatus Sulfotelmatobacter sp.]